mmetsp:Transcript_128870/g.275048  ORF Transcript_128870/g.275048 Transcript_128870/m.275048 type:complete len:276 (-) Transcript_128870:1110-1937(-)
MSLGPGSMASWSTSNGMTPRATASRKTPRSRSSRLVCTRSTRRTVLFHATLHRPSVSLRRSYMSEITVTVIIRMTSMQSSPLLATSRERARTAMTKSLRPCVQVLISILGSRKTLALRTSSLPCTRILQVRQLAPGRASATQPFLASHATRMWSGRWARASTCTPRGIMGWTRIRPSKSFRSTCTRTPSEIAKDRAVPRLRASPSLMRTRRSTSPRSTSPRSTNIRSTSTSTRTRIRRSRSQRRRRRRTRWKRTRKLLATPRRRVRSATRMCSLV